MLPTLIGAGISLAGKLGYDTWKRSDDKSERRQFLDYQNASNYGYYLKSLRESPSAQRQGLEDAGYNPMLAIGNLASPYSGPSSALGAGGGSDIDILGSAKEAAKLVQDVKHGYRLANEKADAEINSINKTRENQTLETESKLLNDAVDRQLKESQIRKNNVESVTKPFDSFAGGAGAAGAVYGGSKLIQATKEAAKKLFPKLAPVAASTAVGIGSQALGTLGIGLPLMYGSAKQGQKQQEEMRKDKDSNWNKANHRRTFYGGGIPSYHNF